MASRQRILLVVILLVVSNYGSCVPTLTLQGNPAPSTALSVFSVAEDIPILQVNKRASATEIYPQSRLLVEVILENVGNRDAVDITITEPAFPEETFAIIGATEYSFNHIAVNETRVFAYSLEAQRLGYFQLESSQVTYYDEDGSRFIAASNDLELSVVEKSIAKEEKTFEWYNVLSIACIAWILLLLLRGLLVKRST